MANTSTLQFPSNKQFIITLPKSLVLAKAWQKSDMLEFILDQTGNIIIQKQESEKISSKSSLQLRNGKQFVITIPKSLVMAKGWKQGDILEFMFNEHAQIVMKKIPN
ncbi:MAG: AbrB/MazE/SpoVT family DNA-binding domain-containing protein [Nanoarchaeota archaeon]|nr:AbrB/MazE/SpoVT family DNA-binding domain-containing protein [Nanoarchaeota archaeon]